MRTLRLMTAMMTAGVIAGPALAQTTPAPSTPPANTAAPAPATGATAATSATVTDTEVTEFAKAALAVEDIQKDTTVPDADKQKKMADTVKSSGLTPARFNAIANASKADQALNKRIQLAAGALMNAQNGNAGAATSTGTDTSTSTDDGSGS